MCLRRHACAAAIVAILPNITTAKTIELAMMNPPCSKPDVTSVSTKLTTSLVIIATEER